MILRLIFHTADTIFSSQDSKLVLIVITHLDDSSGSLVDTFQSVILGTPFFPDKKKIYQSNIEQLTKEL